jgi:hypothetical protein
VFFKNEYAAHHDCAVLVCKIGFPASELASRVCKIGFHFFWGNALLCAQSKIEFGFE